MSRNHRLLAIALGVCAAMPFEVGVAKTTKNQKMQMRSYSVKKPQQQKNKVKTRVGKKQPQVSNKSGRQLKILKNREGLTINKRQPKKVAIPVPKKEEIKVLNSREISVRTSNGKFTKGEIALVSVVGVVGLALIIGGVYVAVRTYKDGRWFLEKVVSGNKEFIFGKNQIINNNDMPPPINNFVYEHDSDEFGMNTIPLGTSCNNQNYINNKMSFFKKNDEDILMENDNVNEEKLDNNDIGKILELLKKKENNDIASCENIDKQISDLCDNLLPN